MRLVCTIYIVATRSFCELFCSCGRVCWNVVFPCLQFLVYIKGRWLRCVHVCLRQWKPCADCRYIPIYCNGKYAFTWGHNSAYHGKLCWMHLCQASWDVSASRRKKMYPFTGCSLFDFNHMTTTESVISEYVTLCLSPCSKFHQNACMCSLSEKARVYEARDPSHARTRRRRANNSSKSQSSSHSCKISSNSTRQPWRKNWASALGGVTLKIPIKPHRRRMLGLHCSAFS
jgi:hypothetical protein